MYDYIKGTLEELSPAEAVVECHSIGFKLQISLNTYDRLQGQKEVRLYVHHHLREDEETLYGFWMMLSSLTADEVSTAIASGDVNRIKGVKGIGLKTAQKVIIELKDKISRGGAELDLSGGSAAANSSEACSALIMLGFTKNAVEKTVASIVKKEPGLSLEDIIKKALKML